MIKKICYNVHEIEEDDDDIAWMVNVGLPWWEKSQRMKEESTAHQVNSHLVNKLQEGATCEHASHSVVSPCEAIHQPGHTLHDMVKSQSLINPSNT